MSTDQWERVHTNKGWHIRFRAANSEPVVHGENLTDKAGCDTAILAVARAHSPVREARFESVRLSNGVATFVAVMDTTGKAALLPVVDVDERTPSRLERVMGAVARRVTS